MFLAISCSSVATREGEHRGADREGGRMGNSGVGGNSAVGDGGNSGGGGGGVNSGVSSTSKNRLSHHKYKSPKQFELKQS